MGQPLFQWAMPDGFPDRAEAWQNNLLPRWQFALALASDELDHTRVPWDSLQSLVGAGSMRETLNNFSLLLLGGELPHERLDALAQTLRDVPAEHAAQAAVAVLVASPQYQWR